MPSHSESSPKKRRKDLERVTRLLRAAATPLYDEMVLLQKLVQAEEGSVENLYRDAGGKKGAVILCLQLADRQWLTIEEILDRMIAGGYPFKAINGRGLLNDGLQVYVKKGSVLRRGNVYGLPGWPEPDSETGQD